MAKNGCYIWGHIQTEAIPVSSVFAMIWSPQCPPHQVPTFETEHQIMARVR